MGIKTVPHHPYSPDVGPCDFWLFPKLRGCRYETIEEIGVTKFIDTLTQKDFHGAFRKFLERYNKCIAAGGDYFEGDYSFMCVLSIKVSAHTKKVWKLIVCIMYLSEREQLEFELAYFEAAVQHFNHYATKTHLYLFEYKNSLCRERKI